MLDGDIDELLRNLEQLQEDTDEDERRMIKRFSKIQEKLKQATVIERDSVVNSVKDIEQ